jgi:hypothetical protein
VPSLKWQLIITNLMTATSTDGDSSAKWIAGRKRVVGTNFVTPTSRDNELAQ